MLASLDQLAHRVDAIVQKLACACSVLCTSTVSGKTWLADRNEAAQGRALPILNPPIPKRVVISDALEASRGLDEWGSSEAAALAPLYRDHLHSIEGALA